MLSWSASFYPQIIINYRRKSTSGLSIDFPTINTLGFACYTVYTSAFLYSAVIREQYAARHPASKEPTVRFNDLAFAVHAVALCVIVYTQFWPSIWGFHVSRFQRISKTMLGLFWGSIFAPIGVILLVLMRSPDGGYDPSTWAWIDVVSGPGGSRELNILIQSILPLDLCNFIYQACHHRLQVRAAGVVEL